VGALPIKFVSLLPVCALPCRWGCRRQDVPNRGNGYHASEWMLVTAGSVTITDGQGKATTHKQGDIFVVPKGLCFAWDQSDDFTKHYVIGDHAAPDAAPTEVICYDRAQPCTGDAEYWFFCTGPEDLAPGSAVPVAASHDYHTSSCGQFSAGLWTCTAHETVVGSYPVHEFIHLLEGSIILTVDDQEHVFEAGDSFFIPQGLECSWRQPAALKKCYIVYTPTAAAPDAKL
jgi:uncharacterized cupin superfamily protein